MELANPRDFLAPVAAFEDLDGEFTITAKFWAACGTQRSIIRLLT